MVIRQLREQDIPNAMKLKILCWIEELADQAENALDLDEEIGVWTEWLTTQDEHNDIRVFIGAFEDSELLGVAAASFVESKDAPQEGIELNGLWVFPEHRGKGISLELMLHILTVFVPLGVHRMEVYNHRHAPSNAFYRKFNARIIRQEYQMGGKLCIDIFEFNTHDLMKRLEETLSRYR